MLFNYRKSLLLVAINMLLKFSKSSPVITIIDHSFTTSTLISCHDGCSIKSDALTFSNTPITLTDHSFSTSTILSCSQHSCSAESQLSISISSSEISNFLLSSKPTSLVISSTTPNSTPYTDISSSLITSSILSIPSSILSLSTPSIPSVSSTLSTSPTLSSSPTLSNTKSSLSDTNSSLTSSQVISSSQTCTPIIITTVSTNSDGEETIFTTSASFSLIISDEALQTEYCSDELPFSKSSVLSTISSTYPLLPLCTPITTTYTKIDDSDNETTFTDHLSYLLVTSANIVYTEYCSFEPEIIFEPAITSEPPSCTQETQIYQTTDDDGNEIVVTEIVSYSLITDDNGIVHTEYCLTQPKTSSIYSTSLLYSTLSFSSSSSSSSMLSPQLSCTPLTTTYVTKDNRDKETTVSETVSYLLITNDDIVYTEYCLYTETTSSETTKSLTPDILASTTFSYQTPSSCTSFTTTYVLTDNDSKETTSFGTASYSLFTSNNIVYTRYCLDETSTFSDLPSCTPLTTTYASTDNKGEGKMVTTTVSYSVITSDGSSHAYYCNVNSILPSNVLSSSFISSSFSTDATISSESKPNTSTQPDSEYSISTVTTAGDIETTTITIESCGTKTCETLAVETDLTTLIVTDGTVVSYYTIYCPLTLGESELAQYEESSFTISKPLASCETGDCETKIPCSSLECSTLSLTTEIIVSSSSFNSTEIVLTSLVPTLIEANLGTYTSVGYFSLLMGFALLLV
ncbi:uncharacterized protein ASCRUDRAFT_157473 [Ascoidea rubescens DSM 1968]|uniref:Ig-like domain-containing protein n=1 Tax=Ascoidea rubescens DSM 1968 TaxID=1344418 RepID=A0A1D2VFA1_9ASCO|nr:hypothetical protein ASCRUDRAFT_157473 [Ascoidea rubescens DSM 1968]ODV60200.1 hypothetical protein ASCRUDRAFT_157473 [Ascoidea rubescens DSM 1968]